MGLKEWEGKVFTIQPLSMLRAGAARDGESSLIHLFQWWSQSSLLAGDEEASSGYRSRNFLLQESSCSVSGLQIWSWCRDKMNCFNIISPPTERELIQLIWLARRTSQVHASFLLEPENREVYSSCQRMMNDLLVRSVELGFNASKDFRGEQG